LVATHALTDANAGNNQRTAVITVRPRLSDIALTNITGPSSITQGETAQFGVTVQNTGEQDVSTSFDVVLTDATHGGIVGTQTVAGLAMGISAILEFAWNTTGVATGGHTLVAQHQLADGNATNNARAIGITVNPPSVHVGNLGGVASRDGNTWSATVEITAHDSRHDLVNGVIVRGSWGSMTSECTTGEGGGNGTCNVVLASIPNSTGLVSFSVSGMTRSGYVYKLSANHDPDGSSNGFAVFVRR
jgi:hypothetical protein